MGENRAPRDSIKKNNATKRTKIQRLLKLKCYSLFWLLNLQPLRIVLELRELLAGTSDGVTTS